MGEQKSEKRERHNFVWFLAKMMRFPLTAFADSLELFVKTFHEMQRIADDGIELFVGGKPKLAKDIDRPTDDTASNTAIEKPDEELSANAPIEQAVSAKPIDGAGNEPEPRNNNRDLRDDLLKLVRYKVLFVKREYEHAFAEQESLIAENLDATAFTAWKAAEFVQRLAKGETVVPEKWLTRNYPPPEYRKGSILKGLPEEDKKYLRVFYQVIERFPREKFKFEEQQIEVLEQIRDSIQSVAESDGQS